MQLNKKNARIVNETLTELKNNDIIDTNIFEKITDAITITKFDFKKLAKWCFIFAIISFIASLSGLVEVMIKFCKLFNNPVGRIFASVFLMISAYYVGFKKVPSKRIFLKEFVVFLGVAFTSWYVIEVGIAFDTGSGRYSILFLFATIIYLSVAFFAKSNLVLIFGILSFGSWLGAETAYFGRGSYGFYMEQPLFFLPLACILIFSAFYTKYKGKFEYFFKTVLSLGLLYLFISLWILSIFGYDDLIPFNLIIEDKTTRLINLSFWSLLFISSCFASIYMGFKEDIYILRGYGITFAFIFFYTKMFEWFWNDLHTSIFFLILAGTLVLIAMKAEKMWLLTEKKFGRVLDSND